MYSTVAETYEPTVVVVRGLIVPVAWTTDVMSPRFMGDVVYFGASALVLA
jgi:hypothetical protein